MNRSLLLPISITLAAAIVATTVVATRRHAPDVCPPPARATTDTAPPRAAVPPVATPTAPSTNAATAPVASPAATPAPAPTVRAQGPSQTATRDARSLRVRDLVVARGVRDHAPIDPSTTVSLAESERVFAFVRVDNRGTGDDTVTVTFEHRASGTRVGLVSLDVPADRRGYRTWAFTRGIQRTGAWEVVVRDEDGRVLARRDFSVTA